MAISYLTRSESVARANGGRVKGYSSHAVDYRIQPRLPRNITKAEIRRVFEMFANHKKCLPKIETNTAVNRFAKRDITKKPAEAESDSEAQYGYGGSTYGGSTYGGAGDSDEVSRDGSAPDENDGGYGD